RQEILLAVGAEQLLRAVDGSKARDDHWTLTKAIEWKLVAFVCQHRKPGVPHDALEDAAVEVPVVLPAEDAMEHVSCGAGHTRGAPGHRSQSVEQGAAVDGADEEQPARL